ncbi:Imidazole glycerol phosphate synthase subunit HisH [Candidatus Johnevansia muelleri]|uniref:Imidazole glycerol phosphate synthase subunit HisH n=1 Tax=Candidatus Johnevansia muelleri TaxID=1495769 RepID=A0A078KDL2_9GAMM|nr:Imidazole glycerol phosphate synthase subunit HisH [Candidatus Evansia muelleri]
MVIAVINYGMGNLHSVVKALEYVTRERVIITYDPIIIKNATRIVLPGQGAIRDCMKELKRTKLIYLLKTLMENNEKPILGICIGLQMLMDKSEENGGIQCLKYFSGDVKKFCNINYKIPHIGWNHVYQYVSHPLWKNIPNGERFYFVHSYYVIEKNIQNISGYTEYAGILPHVAICKNLVFAVQFHPEKSSIMGLKLLYNFVNWYP